MNSTPLDRGAACACGQQLPWHLFGLRLGMEHVCSCTQSYKETNGMVTLDGHKPNPFAHRMARKPSPAVNCCIHLRDVQKATQLPHGWRRIAWAECPVCGASDPYAPADSSGAVCNGDRIVCADCGCVGTASINEHWATIVWRQGESLTDEAFGEFNRLVRP